MEAKVVLDAEAQKVEQEISLIDQELSMLEKLIDQEVRVLLEEMIYQVIAGGAELSGIGPYPGDDVPGNDPRQATIDIQTGRRLGRWTPEEHALFLSGMIQFPRQWTKISNLIKTRSSVQVRTHAARRESKQLEEQRLDETPAAWALSIQAQADARAMKAKQLEDAALARAARHNRAELTMIEKELAALNKTVDDEVRAALEMIVERVVLICTPSQRRAGQSTHTPTIDYSTGRRLGQWTDDEHNMFLEGMTHFPRMWTKIANLIKTRSAVQVRTHAQKYFSNAGELNVESLFGIGENGGTEEEQEYVHQRAQQMQTQIQESPTMRATQNREELARQCLQQIQHIHHLHDQHSQLQPGPVDGQASDRGVDGQASDRGVDGQASDRGVDGQASDRGVDGQASVLLQQQLEQRQLHIEQQSLELEQTELQQQLELHQLQRKQRQQQKQLLQRHQKQSAHLQALEKHQINAAGATTLNTADVLAADSEDDSVALLNNACRGKSVAVDLVTARKMMATGEGGVAWQIGKVNNAIKATEPDVNVNSTPNGI
jgi:SHAQKYF class myb-like DNA-binding protein